MKIIEEDFVDDFENRFHADVQSVRAVLARVCVAEWSSPHDAENSFAGAEHVGNGRLKFKIRGNQYRMVALVDYGLGTFEIRFLGTHDEYDKIDARTV